MTIILDTDVLVAFISSREGKHAQATRLVDEVIAGTWGAPMVTDFVLDEALTLLMVRGAPQELTDRLLALTLGPSELGAAALLPLVRVGQAAFRAAVPLFRRHFRRQLSFTDCTTLALMSERKVDLVASFDRGFDGLAARVDS